MDHRIKALEEYLEPFYITQLKDLRRLNLTTMAQMKFQRIPENTFSVMNTQTTEYHAIVSQPISGTFRLTQFAYWQVIAGGKCFLHFSDELKAHSMENIINVLSTLSLEVMTAGDDVHVHEIELLRGEVEIMRGLLEARMRHCEHERDQMSNKFNPDTYISQKLLLLDIREWLILHSVKIQKAVEQQVVH
jgi:hypothetical protein